MRVHRPGTDGAAAHSLKIVRTRYDSPDSQRLIDELQAEYVWRYSQQDSTPVAAGEFEPPNPSLRTLRRRAARGAPRKAPSLRASARVEVGAFGPVSEAVRPMWAVLLGHTNEDRA